MRLSKRSRKELDPDWRPYEKCPILVKVKSKSPGFERGKALCTKISIFGAELTTQQGLIFEVGPKLPNHLLNS